jgi:hypothetical protein
MLVYGGDLISVDTQPYIIAATRDQVEDPIPYLWGRRLSVQDTG